MGKWENLVYVHTAHFSALLFLFDLFALTFCAFSLHIFFFIITIDWTRCVVAQAENRLAPYWSIQYVFIYQAKQSPDKRIRIQFIIILWAELYKIIAKWKRSILINRMPRLSESVLWKIQCNGWQNENLVYLRAPASDKGQWIGYFSLLSLLFGMKCLWVIAI